MMMEEYRQLRSKVFPVLMPPGEAMARGGGHLAAARLTEELVIAYVLDQAEDKFRYLTFAELKGWNVELAQVHQDAVANLEKLSAEKPMRKLAGPDGKNPMFVWAVGDGYDSGRLLLMDWLLFASQTVEGRLVLAVPDRHWVVACGDRDPRVLQAVRNLVEKRYADSEDSISSRFYTWDGQQIRPYLGVIQGGRDEDLE